MPAKLRLSPYVKYDFHRAGFHQIHKVLNDVIRASTVHPVSFKSDEKCRKCRRKIFHAHTQSMSLTKLTVL